MERVRSTVLGLIMLLTLAVFGGASAVAQTVYSADFQDGTAPGFSNARVRFTPDHSRRFLGTYDNETTSLTLTGLTVGAPYTLTVDVYAIATWDGNSAPGPDIWSVARRGGERFETTFTVRSPEFLLSTPQAYPGEFPGPSFPASTGGTIVSGGWTWCGGPISMGVFPITLRFTARSTTEFIDFSGSNLQGSCDEFWGIDNVVVAQRAPDAVSDTCGGAVVIPASAAAVTLRGTNEGATPDSPPACAGARPTGPGVWYQIAGTGGTITLSTCGYTTFDTAISVFCGACSELSCIAANDDDPGCTAAASRVSFCSVVGRTYFVLVTGYNGATGEFDLRAERAQGTCSGSVACGPCELNPPPGQVLEGEPACEDEYIDMVNAGCSSNPPRFTDVFPARTVLGTTGTFVRGGQFYRDTDWFRFTVDQTSEIVLLGAGRTPMVFGLVNGNGPCAAEPTFDLGSVTQAQACTPVIHRVIVPAGTYYAVATPNALRDVPCGSPYYLNIQATPAGACETASGCVLATAAGCSSLGGTYGGDNTACGEPGYSATTTTSPFEDIRTSGTALVLADDEGSVVPLGFNFVFFDQSFSQIGVSSNGYLSFGTPLNRPFGRPMPDEDEPNNVIAGLWTDLDPSAATGAGSVRYQTLGAAPTRRLVVQWTGVPRFLRGDSNTFQIVLFEADGSIELRYDTITPDDGTNPYVAGAENATGRRGTNVNALALRSGDRVALRRGTLTPPVAVTGGPYEVSAGLPSVMLDATNSFDPDRPGGFVAGIRELQWTVGDPSGSPLVLTNPMETVTLAQLVAQGLRLRQPATVRLRVTDFDDLSALDASSVTYVNAAPAVGAGGPYPAVGPGEVLNLSATPTDPDLAVGVGEVLQVEWATRAYTTAADFGSSSTFATGTTPAVPFATLLNIRNTSGATIFVNVIDASGAIASASTTFALNLPDLRPLAVTPPGSGTFGQTLNVAYSVRNQGGGPALGAWRDRFFLSTDATLSGDDLALEPVRNVSGPVAVDGEYGSDMALMLPTRFTGGTFFVIVRADDGSQLSELSEGNNVLASVGTVTLAATPAPDLAASGATAPASAQWGQPISVSYRARNDGVLAAGTNYVDGVYVNATPTLAGATRIGQLSGVALAPGASALREGLINTPPRFDGNGTFFVIIRMDDAQTVLDPNRENNMAVSAVVTFTATPSADLMAVSVAGPGSADDGQPIEVTWTVRNVGSAGASPPWLDRLWLSPTPVFDQGTARALDDIQRSTGVGPGQDYARTETVTIPAGLSGDWWVVLRTNAAGNLPEPLGTANNQVVSALPISIRQGQLPDLRVRAINLSSEVYVNRPLDVSYIAENAGPGTVNAGWRDRIFFGPDNPGDPTSLQGLTLLSEPAQFTVLSPGNIYGNGSRVTLPTTPGRYRVVVVVDALGQVNETDNANNISVRTIDVIAPEYSVTVSTPISESQRGIPIPINGSATRTIGGGPAANVPVKIHVLVRGVRRILNATTDAGGVFATTFNPLPTEAGLYDLAATHPAVDDPPSQDQFVIHGLLGDPVSRDLRVTPGETGSAAFAMRNVGDLPLSGVVASVTGAPSGVTIVPTVAANIAGQSAATLTLNVSAEPGTTGTSFPTVQVTTAQGATANVTLALELAPPAAQLVSDRSPVSETMVRGRVTPVRVTLRNVGGRPSGPVSVAVSAAPWLSQVSPSVLPSLEANGTVDVNLALAPALDLPLGPYSGSMVVSTANQTLVIPFTFVNTSDLLGDLTVRVEDELTYFAPGSPLLAGATVTVRQRDTDVVVAQAVTGPGGIATFADLPENNYVLTATAEGHGSASQSLLLRAGDNASTIFLPKQLVSYEWTVVPTTIPDRYEITLSATFVTNVPLPVVTIEPNYVDLRDFDEGERQINFTITNQGLISARDVKLNFAGNDNIRVQPLLDTIGDLPANSRVVIPVTFTRTGPSGGNPCLGIKLETVHTIVCQVPRQYTAAVIFALNNPGCGGPGGTITAIGGTAGPGGVINPAPTSSTPVQCDPCAFRCALAALGCIPGPIGCGLGLADNCFGLFLDDPTAIGCGWEVFKCIVDLAPPLAALDCINSLLCKCICLYDRNAMYPFCIGGRGGDPWLIFQPVDENITNPTLRRMVQTSNRYRAFLHAAARSFGDPDWLRMPTGPVANALIDLLRATTAPGSDGGTRITFDEAAALTAAAVVPPINGAKVAEFVARWNRTLDYWAAGIFTTAQVPQGQSTDFLDREILTQVRARAVAASAAEQMEGYTALGQSLLDAREVFINPAITPGAGVCARVRIEISQQAVLTRNAFNATLRITNNDQVGSLSMVGATLRITDPQGVDRTSLFLIRPPTLTNLNDIAGAGTIGPSSTGSSQWIIVPRHDAARTTPTTYFVTGSFQYAPPSGGEVTTVPLFPTEIQVLPNPSLTLKYFLERTVYSNDPFTPERELAVPYSLGLMVTNTGGGAARELTLTSSQPRIVENERGLLIDFNIIGTKLNNRGLNPSLTINFGDIGPGATSVAQFIMTASLQGEFTQFEASFKNLDGLGDPSVSLIDSVRPYFMTHVVRSARANDDQIPDFLVDNAADLLQLPDEVHLSDGSVAPVQAFTQPSVSADPMALTAVVNVSAFPTGGYGYVQFNNPFAALGARAVSARRSDGVEIQPGFNVWSTDRIVRKEGQPPRPENLVRLFDFGGPGVYLVRFEVPSAAAVPTAWRFAAVHGSTGRQLLPINRGESTTDPRLGGVRELRVLFGSPVQPGSFNPGAIMLEGLQGTDSTPVDLSGISISTALEDNDTVGVVRFSAPLPDRALYCLTLSGVRNFLGEPAAENGRVSFGTLAGDVFTDRRVNNTDVGAVVALQGQSLTADAEATFVRADVNADGVIDNADLNAVVARRRTEARFIAQPCPEGLAASGDDANAPGMPDSAWTPGPGRGPRATSDWYTRELSADERAYLAGEGADRAYAARGSVVPLRIRTDVIALRVTGEATRAARRAAELGVDLTGARALGVDGWVLAPYAGDPERVRDAVRRLASAEVNAAPVFVDAFGQLMVPMPAVFAVLKQGTQSANTLAGTGLQVVERAANGVDGLYRLETPAVGDGLAALEAANRFAARLQTRLAEPVWLVESPRGMERLTARALSGVVATSTAGLMPDAPVVAVIDDGVETGRGDIRLGDVYDVGVKSAAAPTYGTLAAGVLFDKPDATVIGIRAATGDRDRVATRTDWLIRALATAQRAGAKVTVTGPMLSASNDALAWAYARARDEGLVHLAPAGEAGVANAVASLPAVTAIGSGNEHGVPSGFNARTDRLAALALGEGVQTADRRGEAGLGTRDRVSADGTFLAAAHAARAAALVWQTLPDGRAGEIERALRLGAAGDEWSVVQGWGMLQLDRVLAAARDRLDLDGDGIRDEHDLKLLLPAVASGVYHERFDLNGDDVVDEADLVLWFEEK